MTQSNILMAEKCEKCGELFDLDFDLKQEVNLEGRDLKMKIDEEHFCWKCRKESNNYGMNEAVEETDSFLDELGFIEE